MNPYEIKIDWSGPFKLQKVIDSFCDGGTEPLWNGEDYGLYQIYGRHILCGEETLLYIGIATRRTFSDRFREHEEWLSNDQEEKDIGIYIGKVFDDNRHSENDGWKSWEEDIKLAERILIYKYAPNYNARELVSKPNLSPYTSVRLINCGKPGKLNLDDEVPRDYDE